MQNSQTSSTAAVLENGGAIDETIGSNGRLADSGDGGTGVGCRNFKEDDFVFFQQITRDADWFVDETNNPYVSIIQDGKIFTYPVSKGQFSNYLYKEYRKSKGKKPNNSDLFAFIELMASDVRDNKIYKKIYKRCASIDGKVYIDLVNSEGQMVVIDSNGWDVTKNDSIPFLRTDTMTSLVTPVSGGSVDDIRNIFPMLNDDCFKLALPLMVEYVRTNTPNPIMYLLGAQGTGKSTLSKIVKKLIDPGVSNEQSIANQQRNFFLNASISWLLIYGNLTKLTTAISNNLCKVATGGSYAVRSIYTNTDVTILNAHNPVILNGIDDFVKNNDLADRCIYFETLPFKDGERISESQFWSQFDTEYAKLLGAFYNVVSIALKHIDSVQLDFEYRMMDYAITGCALEQGLGWEAGSFKRILLANQQMACSGLLDNDDVASVIFDFMNDKQSWSGTSHELLEALQPFIGYIKNFPKSPVGLAGRIRKMINTISKLGITIEMPTEPKYNNILKKTIRKITIINQNFQGE